MTARVLDFPPRRCAPFAPLVNARPAPAPPPTPDLITVDAMARVWIGDRLYRRCGTSTVAYRVMTALVILADQGALPSPAGYPANNPDNAA